MLAAAPPTPTSDETLNASAGMFAVARAWPILTLDLSLASRAERQIGYPCRKVQSDRSLDRYGLQHD